MTLTPKNIHKILSKHMLIDHFDMVLDIAKSSGSFLFDAKSNRKLLDCFSFIASNPVGHNHPMMFDADFERKLLRVAKTNPSNSDLLSLEFAEFVDTFARVAKPRDFKHLFFVAGGSLAVENGLKAAFDWKVNKLAQRGATVNVDRLEVIHFFNAFHGRSGYSLSLTNTDPVKYKDFPKFKWPRFYAPMEGPDFEKQFEKTQKSIRKYISVKKDQIAALIIEPIQGEGGDVHFPEKFHKFLREVTRENEILLIYDEVQTGLGLTGKMWAHQHYGIIPDIVCFGKKTQVCGIMATRRLDESKVNVFNTSSRINSTWGGNLVDMVRSQRYLEIIEKEKLVKNAEKVGKYLLTELRAIEDPDIKNIRGLGLFCAFDLKSKEERNQFIKGCHKEGLLILGSGEKSVRFRPSLNFSKQDVDQAIKLILKVRKG
jgi:L-lysine 6-transaminase